MFSFNSPHYTIRHSVPLSLVEIKWHGFVTSEQLQEGLLHVLTVIHEKKATYLLTDAQLLNALKASDQTWVKKNFFPAISAYGIKKFARITNSNIFTQAIINNFMKLLREEKQYKFVLESFDDRDDALEWMLNDYSMPLNTL